MENSVITNSLGRRLTKLGGVFAQRIYRNHRGARARFVVITLDSPL